MTRWIEHLEHIGLSICYECGLQFEPGSHTGHNGHFTGAWICHDCGPLCDGGEYDE